MIELPEAITIARQINEELKGHEIVFAQRGYSPHKFAFTGKYSHEEFARMVPGKTIDGARADGWVILLDLEPGYLLSLGCGGERILFHENEKTLPKKHQLILGFHDNSYLTVTITGWGEVRLLEQSDLSNHPHIKKDAISPLSKAFTFDYFNKLFDSLPEKKQTQQTSAKYFIISEPGVWGVGNGCLQDILYRAKIHPKRQMLSLSANERKTLYHAIVQTLTKMVELGGRDSEYDLHNQPGRYNRILQSKSVGQSCPECGALIARISYLGGTVYFCSSCQVE
ncbi:MAG: DNA-formamidopyrimidine glycosylase family protein [Candidatus Hodarchaeota archaeon]